MWGILVWDQHCSTPDREYQSELVKCFSKDAYVHFLSDLNSVLNRSSQSKLCARVFGFGFKLAQPTSFFPQNLYPNNSAFLWEAFFLTKLSSHFTYTYAFGVPYVIDDRHHDLIDVLVMKSSCNVSLPMLVDGSKPSINDFLPYYNSILMWWAHQICFENSSMVGVHLIFIWQSILSG